MQSALGSGWEVATVDALVSSDGDGAAGSVEAQRAAAGAEVYIGWGVPPGVARAAAGTLKWAHTAGAGAGGSITREFRATGAVLTNSRGVYAEPIADWVLAAIGFCLQGFHALVAAQRAARWDKDAFTAADTRVRELRDTRVGIVGLGGIGKAVARRCAGLGMTVRAVRRRPSRRRPRGVHWVGGPSDLPYLARCSDVLVITVPRTRDTEGSIGESVLGELPRHAYVINVGRGAILDEEVLLRQLDEGRLAGCVLDVFAREPLPDDHPFWRHPRVLVSPHVSGVSTRFWERETGLIVDNIDRYLGGRRLKNVVDLETGY